MNLFIQDIVRLWSSRLGHGPDPPVGYSSFSGLTAISDLHSLSVGHGSNKCLSVCSVSLLVTLGLSYWRALCQNISWTQLLVYTGGGVYNFPPVQKGLSEQRSLVRGRERWCCLLLISYNSTWSNWLRGARGMQCLTLRKYHKICIQPQLCILTHVCRHTNTLAQIRTLIHKHTRTYTYVCALRRTHSLHNHTNTFTQITQRFCCRWT